MRVGPVSPNANSTGRRRGRGIRRMTLVKPVVCRRICQSGVAAETSSHTPIPSRAAETRRNRLLSLVFRGWGKWYIVKVMFEEIPPYSRPDLTERTIGFSVICCPCCDYLEGESQECKNLHPSGGVDSGQPRLP